MSTVLIADNDRAVSGLLTEVLARRGLRTANAYDGTSARELALRLQPAVLVCDLDMPGLTGLEVIASLAELAARPAVVVVSGYIDECTAARLGELPYVRAVLKKPFDLLRFAAMVDELCRVGGNGAVADVACQAELAADAAKNAPRRP